MRRSRFYAWLIFLCCVLWPRLSPAPSSGGSMGGSGFGGGGGGSGGDSGAMFELLFYLIYYGGRIFFTTKPGFILFLIIVAIVIFVAITNKAKGGGMITHASTPALPMRTADVGGRRGGPYVVMVQVAFAAQGLRLRAELNQLARTGKTGSRQGLAELLQKSAYAVAAVADRARYASLLEDGPLSTLRDLETRFQMRSAEERGRYRRDVIRSEQGQLVTDQKDRLTDQTASGYVVISLIGAFGRPLPAEAVPPTDPARLRQLLEAIRGVTSASTLYAMEVVWTPAAEGDVLREDELLASFPALKGAAGAKATVMSCPFCAAAYDAALPQCPHCGGANTGAIA